MSRSHGTLMLSLPLALVFASVATASAVIFLIVLKLLTLFAVVGLSFTSFADIRAVPTPPADVAACDLVITVLDERGEILDTRQARPPRGKAWTKVQ